MRFGILVFFSLVLLMLCFPGLSDVLPIETFSTPDYPWYLILLVAPAYVKQYHFRRIGTYRRVAYYRITYHMYWPARAAVFAFMVALCKPMPVVLPVLAV